MYNNKRRQDAMKFKIRDKNGREFKVEEVEEVKLKDEDESLTYAYDDDGLSSEEIASLKQLAAVADKLISLVNTSTDENEEEEQIEDEEEEKIEEIEDEEEEQIEEVIDTSKMKTADSIKKSAIAIERKIKADDSLDIDAVSDAWAKRYGGNK